MDPITVITVITTVADLVDLARNVQTQIDLVKQFSSAERDLRPFKQDMRTFRHTLDNLQTILEGATPNLELALRERSLLHTAIRSSKTTFVQLDNVLRQLSRDTIVLQYPPGRPPRRLLKAMIVLRRIREETDRLNNCCHALQANSSLNCDLPTMLPVVLTRTEMIHSRNKEGQVAGRTEDDVCILIPSAQSSKGNRIPNETTLLVQQSHSYLPQHRLYLDRDLAAPQSKHGRQRAIIGLPIGRGKEQDRREDNAIISDIKMWLRRIGKHTPLALAILGSYIMGQFEAGDKSSSGKTKHCTFYNDGLTSCYIKDGFHILPIETPRTNPATNMPLPILIAAMAMTSFSLTAQHYILALEKRDRDMVILAVIGTGVIAGLAAGLDGMAILLQVAPWCAIAAFFVCGFVLPPIKGRRGNADGTLRQGEQVWAGVEEKGKIKDGGQGWAGSGVDIKTDKGENISFLV